MSLGDSTFGVTAGGGQQRTSAAQLSKALVQLGVSPIGVPNMLVQVGDISALLSQLGGKLAEAVAMRLRQGQTAYAMPVTASQPGAVSAVTQVGQGIGAVTAGIAPAVPINVLIKTAGALGTMTFQYSVNNGPWSGVIPTIGAGPFLFAVPGTHTQLSFAAGTYVLNSTYAIGTNGVVVVGGGGTSTVTQSSSPFDDFEVVCSVVTAGALGAAVLGISLDNGQSSMPNMLVPSNGIIVIPGTGLYVTCTGTFTQGDSYSFLAAAPSFATSDLTAALTALRALRNVQFTAVHNTQLPSSTAERIRRLPRSTRRYSRRSPTISSTGRGSASVPRRRLRATAPATSW